MSSMKATLGVLIQERAALDAAIAVLQRFNVTESAAPQAPHRKRRKRTMTAKRRKEIGAAVRAAHVKRRAENNCDAPVVAEPIAMAH